MHEITFQGPEDFYERIDSCGIEINNEIHNSIYSFYRMMKSYKDPNTCSCKKGIRVYQNLVNQYVNIPIKLRTDPNINSIKQVLGTDGAIIFKLNEEEFSRVD
jgi:hypothetical protein